MTVQALAEKAGISKACLSQIENRKRMGTIKVLSSIASALEVSVDLLMDDWLPPPPPSYEDVTGNR